VVEFVSVIVAVPAVVQAPPAVMPVIASSLDRTVIFAVFDALSAREQVPPWATILVTVIVEAPAVVKPVAVNVPLPAVLTVMVAVFPVCDGEEVL